MHIHTHPVTLRDKGKNYAVAYSVSVNYEIIVKIIVEILQQNILFASRAIPTFI